MPQLVHRSLTRQLSAAILVVMMAGLPAIKATGRESAPKASVKVLKTHSGVQFELQEALINAVPGDVIDLQPGVYHFNTELNIACDNITLRGSGRDATILSFLNQSAGSSGIVATGNAFVIENLAVQDTVGNGIKVLGARDVTFRNVRVEWTGGPESTNGAYGIYPVECQNVLIEQCVSIGASDAGIYVGQSQDVIVRGCEARRNVAGIEIENTLRADVYDNSATENTGGILVFDLPGLNLTNGGHVRVFRNRIIDNNLDNFAPKGTMVADVPTGTGVMLMAMDNVEVFDNVVTGHQTSNVLIVSFLITKRKINDDKYDPYPENISVHHNTRSGGGMKPGGLLGTVLSPVIGGVFPDIVFDGVVNPATAKAPDDATAFPIRIRDNGAARFANLNFADFSPINVLSGKYSIGWDPEPFGAQLSLLQEVRLQPHRSGSPDGNPAFEIYRSAPRQLSSWGLFEVRNGRWSPNPELIEYDLNTPLFSDHTIKHRYVRLPAGQAMIWEETESLKFPTGTVIAKTFAYPDDADDKSPGERFIETRIQFLEPTGWYGYSYIWSDDQADASLSLGGGMVDVSWINADGERMTNKYQIPNANQCLSCHSQNKKYSPLGTTASNLNRPGVQKDVANQLTHWMQCGILKDCPAPEERPMLPVFDDPNTGSLDARARAWLEVNCAHCHNPSGSARTSGLDLRTVQKSAAKFGVFKSPIAAGKGSGGRRYDIVPGKPEESILLYRLETDEPGARMPSLARNLNHRDSTLLIREWILSMPASNLDRRW